MKIEKSAYHVRLLTVFISYVIVTIASFYFIPLLFVNQFLPYTYFACVCGIFLISTIVFLLIIKGIINRNFNILMAKSNDTIHRYEAVTSATNDAIWDFDIKTGKSTYNQKLMDIFGYSSNELENNTDWWENNIHPTDKEKIINKVNSFLKGSSNLWEDEYRFRCKNGDYLIVYDRSFIVRDEKGNPIRLIGAMRNVTHLRELEKELLNKQLSEKNLLGKGIIISYENDRKKIKDELHEDVNQILAAIKFYISKYKSENENITTSLSFLDDAIKKIKKISNSLFSSTLELFGLKDAMDELFISLQKESTVKIYLDAKNFDEHKMDKSTSLHLYRIIEDVVPEIIDWGLTNEVNIILDNVYDRSILTIDFYSEDITTKAKLDEWSVSNIRGKLEMFESEMKFFSHDKNYYSIEVKA